MISLSMGSTKEEDIMAFCTKCGTQLNHDAKFCFHCGATIEGPGQPVVPPVPIQPVQPNGQAPVQPQGQPIQPSGQYGQAPIQPQGQPMQPSGQYGQAPIQPPVQPTQPSGQYGQPPIQPSVQPMQPSGQYGQPPVQQQGQPMQSSGQYGQAPMQPQGQPMQPSGQYGQAPVQQQGQPVQPNAQYRQPQPNMQYGQAPQQQQSAQSNFASKAAALNNTADTTGEFDPQDIQNNKAMAILAYIGILVLIPLFAAKESRFARYHTNQGLVLCIAEVAYSILYMIVSTVILAISWRLYFLVTIIGLLGLVFLVFMILGIVNAAGGKAKELPLIGKIRILK